MVWKIIKISIFLLLTGFGAVGNLSVLMNSMCTSLVDTNKRSTQLILIHLAFTNIVTLSSKATSTTTAALGLRNVLNDAGCQVIVYVNRVARGFCICTSSLLAVVQAATISPRAPGRGKLKLKSARHLSLVLLFFWVLNALVSMNLLHSASKVLGLKVCATTAKLPSFDSGNPFLGTPPSDMHAH